MNKNLFRVSNQLQDVFSEKFIRRVSFRTKFVQRRSKLDEEKFLSLCVFYNDDLCENSLSQISAKLASNENINISKQALHERFNAYAGEIFEIGEIYVSKNRKLKCRLIINKLTKEQKKKKIEAKVRKTKKKGKKVTLISERFNDINMYITNIPDEVVNKDKVYELYSIRWQIEIMFKIWKSIFKIHATKKVKIERFQCCLYGKLISLLLTSDIFFTVKKTAI